MTYSTFMHLHLCCKILAFLLVVVNPSFALNREAILLLNFKSSVLSDPLGVLQTWNYNDQNPCSWTGVTCSTSGSRTGEYYYITALSLPNSQLLGSIPPDLGMIRYLQVLNLSNNSINGSIPFSLYNNTQLRILDFSNNLISGELPEFIAGLTNLQYLNLSNNALAGEIPENITSLKNLRVLSLRNNYFGGNLPSGFDSVVSLDLSSNLINGSLPPNFGGNDLHYLNISYNRFSGEIPVQFTNKIPVNATIDLSFNNFSGEIPETSLFGNQENKSFSGNPELCGKVLKNPCPIPSTVSIFPNVSSPTSTPAIAAIPKIDSNSPTNSPNGSGRNSLKASTIAGIVAGDIAGVGILALIFIFVYQLKKKRKFNTSTNGKQQEFDWSSSSQEEQSWMKSWACLLKRRNDETSSSEGTTSESDQEEAKTSRVNETKQEHTDTGSLVTVDGERELELETLLKASAYILGATGSSIMYKALLEDGTTLAVRRIGESGVERFRDFQNQVRVIAKLVHPNLVRIRGFYWGADEKLVIYDYVPNGSLVNARYRKVGSSPCPLPWEVRLKIARGVARGLTYIHEKKHVHGNLKPSNILLGQDMEPKIGDFGLERLVAGENSSKAGGSARNFGSKRSTASRESFQDLSNGLTPNPSPSPSSMGCVSPYYAPESLRSLKPNQKWDVYSFGVILLELLTGKVVVLDEAGLEPAMLAAEEKGRVLRMVDMAIRADVEGKEDALLALLKLGFSCISPVPHKRPTMKEAHQLLDKFPSCSTSFYFG
ncbi:hypothetical protein LguiB_009296 [Lonicera macranthoides]